MFGSGAMSDKNRGKLMQVSDKSTRATMAAMLVRGCAVIGLILTTYTLVATSCGGWVEIVSAKHAVHFRAGESVRRLRVFAGATGINGAVRVDADEPIVLTLIAEPGQGQSTCSAEDRLDEASPGRYATFEPSTIRHELTHSDLTGELSWPAELDGQNEPSSAQPECPEIVVDDETGTWPAAGWQLIEISRQNAEAEDVIDIDFDLVTEVRDCGGEDEESYVAELLVEDAEDVDKSNAGE